MQRRFDVSQTDVRNLPNENQQRPRLVQFLLRWFCFHRDPEGQSVQGTIAPEDVMERSSGGRTKHSDSEQDSSRGGWRTMPCILGNDLCEKLATSALTSNLITYLTTKYNMHQVTGATVISINSGTGSLTPLLAAYLSDAYIGRFRTIVIACIASVLGISFLAISAVSRSLRPSARHHASGGQLAFLFTGFLFSAIGLGGIRSCSYAFGADQFNQNSPNLKKTVQSFFNWYFFFTYMGSLLGVTVLVYIQDNIGWGWGYGTPAICSVVALLLFCLGYPLYRFEVPGGSPYTSFARVFVAAFRKRSLALPSNPEQLFEVQQENLVASQSMLRHTSQFRCLDHAAIKTSEEYIPADGRIPNPWRLCTVTQVEEFKVLLRLFPIWISSVLYTTAHSSLGAFNVRQANTMDRHLGPSFQVPGASFSIFIYLTPVLWLPIYDRILVPAARRRTGNQRGIQTLQRIGIGLWWSTLDLIVSGSVESKRRHVAITTGLVDHPDVALPVSAFWLVPQFCLRGLSDAFWSVGKLDLLYDQLPSGMVSMAGAVYYFSVGVGDYTGSIVLQAVHRTTGWLQDNLSRGHLDYYFYLLGALQFLNLLYFLVVSTWYTYKKTLAPPPPPPPTDSKGSQNSSWLLQVKA